MSRYVKTTLSTFREYIAFIDQNNFKPSWITRCGSTSVAKGLSKCEYRGTYEIDEKDPLTPEEFETLDGETVLYLDGLIEYESVEAPNSHALRRSFNRWLKGREEQRPSRDQLLKKVSALEAEIVSLKLVISASKLEQ